MASTEPSEEQSLSRLTGLTSMILINIILQLFLVTMSLQIWMLGGRDGLFPATMVSLVLFAINFWLYRRMGKKLLRY